MQDRESPRFLSHPIDKIEDLSSPVWGLKLDVTQLTRGDVSGSISHTIFAGCAVSFGHFKSSASLRARGEIADAALSLAVLMGARRPAFIWGTETEFGDGTMLSAAGGEYDVALPDGAFAHFALVLPAERGFAIAQALAPILIPLLSAPAVWHPSDQARRALRVKIFEAVQTLDEMRKKPCRHFDGGAFASTVAADFLAAMEMHEGSPHSPVFSPDARIVREVEELLRDDEAPIVSVAALCLRLGIGRRTLERAFRHFLDISPLKYVMVFRLCRAHKELARGDGSVTDVATRHGFYELGRFSMRYRQLFGELPSETLALRRRSFLPLVGLSFKAMTRSTKTLN
jgi:AraC family ethanolamine operon transcriptional activator